PEKPQPIGSQEVEAPISQEARVEERHADAPPEAATAAWLEDRAPEGGDTHIAEEEPEKQQRWENMNVASGFGGGAVETPEREEAEQQAAEEKTESADSAAANSLYGSGEARGVVEEEEIEEEESELPDLDEERLDLADYEELEEEELAPADDQM